MSFRTGDIPVEIGTGCLPVISLECKWNISLLCLFILHKL